MGGAGATAGEQAEEEGLHTILQDAGFDWRQPGCSMCLAMNTDKLTAGERCASTSTRNFAGRQGGGARAHAGQRGTAVRHTWAKSLSRLKIFEIISFFGQICSMIATDVQWLFHRVSMIASKMFNYFHI